MEWKLTLKIIYKIKVFIAVEATMNGIRRVKEVNLAELVIDQILTKNKVHHTIILTKI